MRITVTLDDELYAMTKLSAQSDNTSISKKLNEALRNLFYPKSANKKGRNINRQQVDPQTGFPIVPCKRTFTTADVQRLEAEVF
jgi:hypothetical protein